MFQKKNLNRKISDLSGNKEKKIKFQRKSELGSQRTVKIGQQMTNLFIHMIIK